jgi:hypothetical protein
MSRLFLKLLGYQLFQLSTDILKILKFSAARRENVLIKHLLFKI